MEVFGGSSATNSNRVNELMTFGQLETVPKATLSNIFSVQPKMFSHVIRRIRAINSKISLALPLLSFLA